MINAETFLANLQNSTPTATPSSSFTRASICDIPDSILRVCELGWRVAPILAHSTSASIKSSMTAPPTSDILSLALSAHERCNWAFATGRGLLILEVNLEEAYHSLQCLCGGEWGWQETLRFRHRTSRFFAFSHSERQVRFLGSRFPGIKLHWEGSAVLIPPSWFVYGPPVTFDDPNAPVLRTPQWLQRREVNGNGVTSSRGRDER